MIAAKIFIMSFIMLLVAAACLGLSNEENADVNILAENVQQAISSTELPPIATAVAQINSTEIPQAQPTTTNEEKLLVNTTSSVPRSKSRAVKKTADRELANSQLELLPIRTAKPKKQQEQLRASSIEKPESEPIIGLKGSSDTQFGLKDGKGASMRRGKVRYLSGKELGRDDPAVKVESKYEADQFRFSYATKDGQLREEHGVFENQGSEEQNLIVKGSYSYFDEQNIEYIVNYTADRHGFRPVIMVKNPNKQ